MKTNKNKFDKITKIQDSTIQHGQFNKRIYLMKLGSSKPQELMPQLERIAKEQNYTKIFAKVPASNAEDFENNDYIREALVPDFYNGTHDAVFLSKYLDKQRSIPDNPSKLQEVLALANKKRNTEIKIKNKIHKCAPHDIHEMAQVYKKVFASYPFPIFDPDYLLETMKANIQYYCIKSDQKIIALSSAEMDIKAQNVEMTDFATLPSERGKSLAAELLKHMQQQMIENNMKTAYTIARAISPGMNITFAKAGYTFAGTLTNNTNISGQIESMNIWYKSLI